MTIVLLLKRVDCNDGVASYLEMLCRGLSEAGNRVVLITGPVTTLYNSQPREAAIRAACAEWIVEPALAARGLGFAQIRLLRGILRGRKVDVISPQGFAVLPLASVISRWTGIPIVLSYHPSVHGSDARSLTSAATLKQTIAYRVVARCFPADYYIASSTEIADFFIRTCWIPKGRVRKQVLGVDTDFYFAPTEAQRYHARARFGLDPAAFVAVLPGRLNVNKGHDVLALAVKQLARKNPQRRIVCLFPGGGDQRDEIETLIRRSTAELALDTFCFLGFVDQTTLRETYWAADVVVLPSRVEGFALAVAEAMCCGAIAIRTPSGGWQDQIIVGETGYVVPFDDAVALAQAMEIVMTSTDRLRLKANVLQFAKKFAKGDMIAGTLAIYQNAAGRKQSRQRELESHQTRR